MSRLNRQDADLHYPDGSHRSTPPTADGSRLELWEMRIRAHRGAHRLGGTDYSLPEPAPKLK